MSRSRRAIVLIFCSILCLVAIQASRSVAGQGHEEVTSSSPMHTITALKITTADGSWYLQLGPGGASDMGPVRLPVKDEIFGAVLVSLREERDRVVVTLAGERGELETAPIGRYELPLASLQERGEKALSVARQGQDSHAVVVSELEGWKSGPWRLELKEVAVNNRNTIPGCCSCSNVNCCPDAGKCFGCSSCGQCCG